MNETVHTLLEGLSISESNCPRGARVAVVTYNSNAKYVIRFSDYHRSRTLMEAVSNIPFTKSSNRRSIGEAMRFVAHNVFKRTRQALLTRKVAIFITKGQSAELPPIISAKLELSAQAIITAVIAFNRVPNVRRAFGDNSLNFMINLMREGRISNQLEMIKTCILCYDHCNPAEVCTALNILPVPQKVNMDLAVVMDSSQNVQADQYHGVQELLGSVLQQIDISTQPTRQDKVARVAIVQQGISDNIPTVGQIPVRVEFDLMEYQDVNAIKTHILQNMRQVGGRMAIGYAVEWTIENILLRATQQRKSKVVLVFVGGETSSWDRAKLETVALQAKCQGVVLVTVTMGHQFNCTQAEELASFPLAQHVVHLGQVKKGNLEYADRFLRAFFDILSRDLNRYPHRTFVDKCRNVPVLVAKAEEWEGVPVESVTIVDHHEKEEYTEETEVDNSQTETYEEIDVRPEILPGRGDSILFLADPASCSLPADAGSCKTYAIRWYFDLTKNKCARFWYSGCGGNANRFDSQKKCEAACMKTHHLRVYEQEREIELENAKFCSMSGCGKKAKFDLMFFVHYSKGKLQHFKDFIKNVVSDFNFEEFNMKIGLAFIPPQKGGFNLDNISREEILRKIESVEPRATDAPSETPLPVFLRRADQYFRNSSGGRPGESVPQIAVFLTDYIGNQTYKNSAINLHLAGITVYTVYVGTEDSSQLFYVASYPSEETSLQVRSYQDLSSLPQTLKGRICYNLTHKDEDYWKLRKLVEKSCSKHMKADIYFLIDGSESVSDEEFNKIKVFVNDTVQFFPVRPQGVRFGVVQYANETKSEIVLGEYSNRRDLRCHIHYTTRMTGNTDIGKGLRDTYTRLKSMKRPNTPQYLVVLMDYTKDGNHDEKQGVPTAVMADLQEQNVIVYAISDDMDFLDEMTADPEAQKHLSSFAFLKNIELQLAQNICKSAALQSTEADVILLLASSGISSYTYDQMKRFLKAFVDSIDPEKSRVRVGVVQYSNTVREEFSLATKLDRKAYHQAIDNMREMQGSTLTGKALRSVLKLFRTAAGNQEKVLVVIADEPSQDSLSQPLVDLRGSGIDIYAVRTSDTDHSQLKDITGTDKKIFYVHNNFSDVANALKDKIQLECLNQDIADIVFVVDVSSGIGSEEFKTMKNFMISVVNNFDIGDDNVRVGVTLFGENVLEAFGLSSYGDIRSLEAAIRNLNPSGIRRNSRSTSKAIEFSKGLLSDSRGGRQRRSIPQFLITIVHKDTSDRNRLPAVCDNVRASGIHTLAVGIVYQNVEDLGIIGGSDSRYFSVNAFQNLKHVSRRVTQAICSVPCKIFFRRSHLQNANTLTRKLISEENFEREKNFVKSVVQHLSAYESVRVGLAQFSSDCVVYFKLRSFYPRSEFYDAIGGIEQEYAGTKLLNALVVSRSFFTPDQKRDSVVPRLIVMTDGIDKRDPQAAIAQAAKDLRDEDGVDVLVVAVGDEINALTLNRIAGDPSNVIRVASHADLGEIVPRVVRAVCDSPQC
ncbi:collagen alpha-6(VI) chain-like, partial [Scleropages formosus]